MGCDIHLYAEVRENDKWKKLGPLFADHWSAVPWTWAWPEDADGKRHSTRGKRARLTCRVTDEPYRDRNYTLFGILAGVRWDDCLDGFGRPRGLPKDVSPQVKRLARQWDGDGHSHSYLTLTELLAYDWWRHGTEDEDINHWYFQLMAKRAKYSRDEYIKAFEEVGGLRKRWMSYAELCPEFVDMIRELTQYIPDSPDNVRIVFWFDN